MRILRTVERSRDDVIADLKASIQKVLRARGKRPTAIFITGGSSTPFWMDAVFGDPELLRYAAFFLTDWFSKPLAVAEGRTDTNEASVLNAGVAAAIADQKITAAQLIWPDGRLGDTAAIAADYGAKLVQFRGAAAADIVLASAGGPTYTKGGPVDPGHFAAMKDGDQALIDARGPFLTISGMQKPPSKRLSMSVPLALGGEIQPEDEAFMAMFCMGEAKLPTLENILAGLPMVKCPASVVRHHRNGVLVTDIPSSAA